MHGRPYNISYPTKNEDFVVLTTFGRQKNRQVLYASNCIYLNTQTTVITRKLWSKKWSFRLNIKYANEHETSQLCSVNRPISFNK